MTIRRDSGGPCSHPLLLFTNHHYTATPCFVASAPMATLGPMRRMQNPLTVLYVSRILQLVQPLCSKRHSLDSLAQAAQMHPEHSSQ